MKLYEIVCFKMGWRYPFDRHNAFHSLSFYCGRLSLVQIYKLWTDTYVSSLSLIYMQKYEVVYNIIYDNVIAGFQVTYTTQYTMTGIP